MGRKIKHFCICCGEEILDRTYPTAKSCKKCMRVNEQEYNRDYYKVQKLFSSSLTLSFIKPKEVESYANRDLIFLR